MAPGDGPVDAPLHFRGRIAGKGIGAKFRVLSIEKIPPNHGKFPSRAKLPG